MEALSEQERYQNGNLPRELVAFVVATALEALELPDDPEAVC